MQAYSIQPGEPEAGYPVDVVVVKDPAEQRKRLYDLIERCAFELYESRGRQEGHALEDWRNVELKVLCSESQCPVGYIELGDVFEVEAAVEGFRAEELEVIVGPRRLTVSGARDLVACAEEQNDQTGPGVKPLRIFGVVELPAEVDPSNVTATLKRGMLHAVVPKAKIAERPHAKRKAA